jgi:hypothetical protein
MMRLSKKLPLLQKVDDTLGEETYALVGQGQGRIYK